MSKYKDKPEDYGHMSATEAVLAKLKSKHPKTRREAINALGQIKTKKVVHILLKSLKDPAWTNRQIAAEALINIGEVAIEPMIAVLDDESEDVRYWATEILGHLGGEGVMHLAALLESPERMVRLHVARCIHKSKDSRVLEPLVKALGDADWTVRKHAAEGIEIFGELGVPHLQKAFQTNLNPMGNDDVCFWAIRILGRVLKEKALPVFNDLLANKDKNIRFYAIGALGETMSPAAVIPLIESLKDPSWLVRRHSYEMLEKIGNHSVDALKEAFFKGNDDIKYWAVRLIARILKGDAVEILKKLLNTQEKEIRYFVVTALGETKDLRAIPTLIECFKDNYWQLRAQACSMVAGMKHAAIPMLENALGNESEDVRYWAVRALGKIGGRAIQTLLEVKKHPNNRMRLFAIYALFEIGTADVIEPLIEGLGDQSWPVRNAAGESLEAMGKDAMKPLIRAIGADNDDISFWAQKVLANFGDKAVQTLIDCLESPEKDKKDRRRSKQERSEEDQMRRFAIIALGKISTTASLKPLLSLLDSEDVDDCDTVVEALGEIKNPELVEKILEAIATCKNESVISWLVKILTNIGDAGKPVFFKSLRSDSREVRYWVVKVLGAFEGKDILRALLFALRDPDSEVRAQAIQSLEGIADGTEAVPFLVKMLEDDSFETRLEAYKMLGKTGESQSVATMISRFVNEEEDNQKLVMDAFQQVESSSLMISLLRGLNAAAEEEVQKQIVRIVEKICDSPVKRDLLVKTLDPIDPTATVWGVKILAQFEDESVVDGIISLLKAEDKTVFTAATIALSRHLSSGNWVIRDKVSAALTDCGENVIKPLLMGTDRNDDFMKMNVFQVIENMGEEVIGILDELTQNKEASYYHLSLELFTSMQRTSSLGSKKWKPKPKDEDVKKSDSELEDIMARMQLK